MRSLGRVVFQYRTNHGTEAGKGESLNETGIDFKALCFWCAGVISVRESRFSSEYLVYGSFDPYPQTPRLAVFL